MSTRRTRAGTAADSPATLQYQIDCLREALCQPETENSWDKIQRAIESLGKICSENSEEYHQVVTSAVRSLSRPLTSAMISERTRLSGAAVDFVGAIATSLERNFETLIPIFIPGLLTLCSRTNKVFGTRARACISIIIEMTQLASLLPYFVQAGKDKSALLRHAAAEAGLACLNSCNPQDLEKESRIRDIETMVRTTAKDANADVRKVGKKIFQAYQALMPDRIAGFAAPLSPTLRKYLELPAGPQALPKKESRPNLRTLVKSKSHAHLSSSASSVRSTSPTLSSSVGVGPRVPERPMSSMSRAPPAPSHSYSKLRNEMGPPPLPHTRSQPAQPPQRPQSTLSRSTSAMERPRSMMLPSVAALRTVAPSSSSELGVAVPRARVTGAVRVRPESIHGMPSAGATTTTTGSTVMARRVPAREPSPTDKAKDEKKDKGGHLFIPKRPMSAVDPAMASTSSARSDNGHRTKAPPPPPVLGKGKEKETSKPLPKITAKLTTSARAVSVTAKDRVASQSKPSVSRQASATIQHGSRFAPSRSASGTHPKPSPAEEEGAPAFPVTESEAAAPAPTARPTHKVTASLTISKERHAPRTGGLSQPTQAQLARQRPPVERKVTAPAPSKPGWGRTGAAPPPRARTVSTTALSKAADAAAKPGPRQRVVSMRPGAPALVKKSSVSSLRVDAAKVPLPPSPRPAEKKKRATPSPAPVEEEAAPAEEEQAPAEQQEQEHLSQVLEEEDVFEEKKVLEQAKPAPEPEPTPTPVAPEPTPVAAEVVPLPEEENVEEEEDAPAADDGAESPFQDTTPRKSTPPAEPTNIAFHTTAATPPTNASPMVPTNAGPAITLDYDPATQYNPTTPARHGYLSSSDLDKTPISQLLMSIERGFHWTPEPPEPLTPAEAYRDMPTMSGALGQPIPIHLKKQPEGGYDG
ncbi:hypothetical protein K525DRAFT_359195 [Schizophyllum commune Loenen D]|nr:hypothetical protein K525DRAFT_359195 [Schizophyllum commune Loenen D]